MMGRFLGRLGSHKLPTDEADHDGAAGGEEPHVELSPKRQRAIEIIDKLNKMRTDLVDTLSVTRASIAVMLRRGEKIEVIQDRSDELMAGTFEMRVKARHAAERAAQSEPDLPRWKKIVLCTLAVVGSVAACVMAFTIVFAIL